MNNQSIITHMTTTVVTCCLIFFMANKSGNTFGFTSESALETALELKIDSLQDIAYEIHNVEYDIFAYEEYSRDTTTVEGREILKRRMEKWSVAKKQYPLLVKSCKEILESIPDSVIVGLDDIDLHRITFARSAIQK